MSNWRFKKGIFPLPPVKKRIWEEKKSAKSFVFLAQFIAFLKNCFIYTHCDLKKRQEKKYNGQFFSSLYFFILLFLHHTLLLTSMKEKTTPPLIKTTTLAPLFNLANNYASIDQ